MLKALKGEQSFHKWNISVKKKLSLVIGTGFKIFFLKKF